MSASVILCSSLSLRVHAGCYGYLVSFLFVREGTRGDGGMLEEHKAVIHDKSNGYSNGIEH